MSRRKHLAMQQQSIEAPEDGQCIVRAVGSRGGNMIEVEYPDKRTTLCLLPAKFHKKLWIKKGNYLYIESLEDAEDTDSRVTGQIVRVLFGDDVKQLKKMEGVWPAEFELPEAPLSKELSDELRELVVKEGVRSADEGGSGSESDDDLPPIQRINNRRVIEYEVSESESEEE